MTAFHRRGQLEREARSCFCEVPTDKYCLNAMEHFLTRLRHHHTKYSSGSVSLYYVKPFGTLSGPLTEALVDSGASSQCCCDLQYMYRKQRLRNTSEKNSIFPPQYNSPDGGTSAEEDPLTSSVQHYSLCFLCYCESELLSQNEPGKRVIMSRRGSVFCGFPPSTVNFHEWQEQEATRRRPIIGCVN